MKLLLLTFLLSFTVFGQDFSKIKEKTDRYPKKLSVEKLSKKIDSDFSSKEEKTKAIYCWLTKNIRYDLEAFYNPTNKKRSFKYRTLDEKNTITQGFKDEIVTKTLKDNKGICEGYAQTFAKICNLLHIENAVIDGYVKSSYNDIGKPIQKPNHSWNAVKIDNNWIYIDATWGAGHQSNGKWFRKFKPYFFNIPKDLYFKTHLPEDSYWILKVGSMNKTTFYNQPIYSERFLNTAYKLTKPTSGFLKKEKNGEITVVLKNIDPSQKIHFAFLSEKFAKPATVSTSKDIIKASIIPPKKTTHAFLMIDLEVMIYFKILK